MIPVAIAPVIEHIGDVYTIIESGQKVYIGEDLPGEYTQSEYTKAILRNNPSITKAKNRASANIGEMVEIATNRRWEKTKHTNSKDAKYGMYRYDTRFGFPLKNNHGEVVGANIYNAELLIRNASDGRKYLYDIVRIKKDIAASDWLTQRVTSAAGKPAGQKGDVSIDNIAQDAKNVKRESDESMDAKTESAALAVLKSDRSWAETDYMQDTQEGLEELREREEAEYAEVKGKLAAGELKPREELTTKAKNYLQKAERTLLNRIRYALHTDYRHIMKNMHLKQQKVLRDFNLKPRRT